MLALIAALCCPCGPGCKCPPGHCPGCEVQIRQVSPVPKPSPAPPVKETPGKPLVGPTAPGAGNLAPPPRKGQEGAFPAQKLRVPEGFGEPPAGTRWVKYPSGQWGLVENHLPDSAVQSAVVPAAKGVISPFAQAPSTTRATPVPPAAGHSSSWTGPVPVGRTPTGVLPATPFGSTNCPDGKCPLLKKPLIPTPKKVD